MTSEKLEELLGRSMYSDEDLRQLSFMAPSLARRVLAADKLIEKMDSVIESRHIIALVSVEDIDELDALDAAYREASK